MHLQDIATVGDPVDVPDIWHDDDGIWRQIGPQTLRAVRHRVRG